MTRPLHIGPAALPGPLRTVAELVDVATALAVARALGGRRTYIPTEIGRRHPLARAVGLRVARLIVSAPRMDEHMDASRRIHWPSATPVLRTTEAQRLWMAGKSVDEIVEALQLTRRTVERYVSGIPKGRDGCPRQDTHDEAACPVCGHRRRRRAAATDDRQLELIRDAADGEAADGEADGAEPAETHGAETHGADG